MLIPWRVTRWLGLDATPKVEFLPRYYKVDSASGDEWSYGAPIDGLINWKLGL